MKKPKKEEDDDDDNDKVMECLERVNGVLRESKTERKGRRDRERKRR